jgi:hypothetical protein
LHCTAQKPQLEESQTRKDSDHPEMLMFVKVQKYVMADEDRYQIIMSCFVAKKHVVFFAACALFEFGPEANVTSVMLKLLQEYDKLENSVRAVKRREKEKVQSVLKSEIPMDQWHELVMQHADSTLST